MWRMPFLVAWVIEVALKCYCRTDWDLPAALKLR
jgi:hypothetical protein